MAETVTNNEAKSRYELHAEGGVAVAAYERRGDVVAFTHTMVPEQLRGRGLAGTLVKAALADVRDRGLKILPECAFVIDYVDRHPETQDLLAR
ncbi:GNAT family N-acetyltransferase [Sphingomonas crusticola]|uniref:GNAT family N-acetyltransferase n=1 Tax=Sphingomonas crusticola TaxID=1697973 RepID=UPI000E24F8C2|nr:GNAT family N-acetyltransferase [Sphingomonas crusticola]